MADTESKILEIVTRLLAPTLRALKYPLLIFLVLLALLILSFFFGRCEHSVSSVVAFTIAILIIAFLGVVSEVYRNSALLNQKVSDDLVVELREKVREIRRLKKAPKGKDRQ